MYFIIAKVQLNCLGESFRGHKKYTKITDRYKIIFKIKSFVLLLIHSFITRQHNVYANRNEHANGTDQRHPKSQPSAFPNDNKRLKIFFIVYFYCVLTAKPT